MQEQAERLIAEVLRPLIEADGGSLELVAVEGRRIVLRLAGACSGCPGKPYTLERVIEPMLRRELGVDLQIDTLHG